MPLDLWSEWLLLRQCFYSSAARIRSDLSTGQLLREEFDAKVLPFHVPAVLSFAFPFAGSEGLAGRGDDKGIRGGGFQCREP